MNQPLDGHRVRHLTYAVEAGAHPHPSPTTTGAATDATAKGWPLEPHIRVVERVQLTNPTTCSSTSAPTAGLFVHLARLRAELPALQIVDIRGPGEAANGFGDVSNLLGGLRAWVAAGQPVTVPAAG